MKIQNPLLFLLLTPALAMAGEPSKGTVIMISGISSWLLISSGFILWKELRRAGSKKEQK
ncbi:MAG: hypothetical protein AAF065_02935 [Verrucomicrobiota bacterium]